MLHAGADCACILVGVVKPEEIREWSRAQEHFAEVKEQGRECTCALCTGRVYGAATIKSWRQWRLRSTLTGNSKGEVRYHATFVLERSRGVIDEKRDWHWQHEEREVTSSYEASLMTGIDRAYFVKEARKALTRVTDEYPDDHF